MICVQAEADADYMLTSTTISYAEIHTNCPVVLVDTDTDLLVMLIDKVTSENVYILYSHNNFFNISDLQKVMHYQSRRHILLAHETTGCDTYLPFSVLGRRLSQLWRTTAIVTCLMHLKSAILVIVR